MSWIALAHCSTPLQVNHMDLCTNPNEHVIQFFVLLIYVVAVLISHIPSMLSYTPPPPPDARGSSFLVIL